MEEIKAIHNNSEDLWKIAFSCLSNEDQTELEKATHETGTPVAGDPTTSRKLQQVAACLKLTKEAEDKYKAKARTFKRKNGQVVVVRDVFAKVARWMDHFKTVGDTAVQFDPVHAALPWAGVRFVLQICIDYFEIHDVLLEKIPIIAEHIRRCELLEKLLPHAATDAATELRQALVKAYAGILTYLANIKKYYQKTTKDQFLQGIKQASSQFNSAFDDIINAQKRVEACLQLASLQEQLNTRAEVRRILTELDEPIKRWNKDLADITDKLERSVRTQILQWISKEPYPKHHQRERESFLKGTGAWLLTHPIYKQWKEESASSILWLHGIPGSGKSKLTSLVVEEARIAFQERRAPYPVYFYCSRNPSEPGRSDSGAIIASIVRQLSSVEPGKPILEPTIKEYRSHQDDGFDSGFLQLQESIKLLLQLLEKYTMATIIIDALDECQVETRKDLLSCLERLLQESPTLVKIFVSSRDDGDIVNKLETYPNLELSSDLNSNDITNFVKSETESLIETQNLLRSSSNKNELKQKVIQIVSTGANGMFRWASLQLQSLCESKTDDAVVERLGQLPKTLRDLYQEILEKIKKYEAESDRTYAENALAWLLCSRSPLRSKEFLLAISATYSPSSLTLNINQVLDLCCNLIIFDSTLDNFRFAHLSVREFLEASTAYDTQAINSLAAQACLTTLLNYEKASIMKEYASLYWASHSRDAGCKRKTGNLAILLERFMANTTPVSPFTLWHNDTRMPPYLKEWERQRYCKSEPLSINLVASVYNFAEFIQWSAEKNQLDKCMVAATKYGSLDVLVVLCDQVSITDDVVKTAAGNEENGKDIMALLLEKRGDQVSITDDVVKIAVGNHWNGKDIMALLFEKRGDQVSITDGVVKTAAGNEESGKDIIEN